MISGFNRSGVFAAALLAAAVGAALGGCAKRATPVSLGDEHQVLHWGNLDEPNDLDPQIITNSEEANIVISLFEGLTAYDPKDCHPVPGVAERWESSPDARVWTFHLRPTAKWSNGDQVTADDFVYSYRRMLSARLASEYASMVFHLENGEAYYQGKVKDFSKVGAKAVDDHTLVLTLWHPIPYFPSLLCHQAWYPVHRNTIEKFGAVDERGSAWTRPENMVCNGPFVLAEWKPHQVIRITKSPTYWDHANVKLAEADFHPIEEESTEEAAFRSGQLHVTAQVPIEKIATYKRDGQALLREFPQLATYYYRFNVSKPPFNDARVRRALSLAVDRLEITEHVSKGGQQPAGSLTPPGTGGFYPKTTAETDIPQARRLLAEAGYPGGTGFPHVELLYNTTEGHRRIAEAIQEMWKKNLGVNVALVNEEGKVWNDSMRRGDYQIARYAWVGDYLDPSTFMDLMETDNTNNETFWSNPEYDAQIEKAKRSAENETRYECFQRCEQILQEEVPILPIYYYERNMLVRPEVHGWYDNLLDIHPLNRVYLSETE